MIDINFGQTHLFIKLQQKYNSIHIVSRTEYTILRNISLWQSYRWNEEM